MTFIAQFRGTFSNHIRSYDIFSLIPSWSFFAPNPGTVDYNIVCKIKTLDNEVKFKYIETIVQRNNLLYSIWNPHKRKQKAIVDVVQAFARLPPNSSGNLPITMPYLILLNYLTSFFTDAPDGSQLQFLIYESQGIESSLNQKVIFVSDFHTL